MAFMSWNDNLATGIEIVDEQHRGLLELVNEAAPVLAQLSAKRVQDPGPLLARLMDYAATHFRTEEELMARRQVDERVLGHHRRSHARFVEQVSVMVESFASGGDVTGDQVLSFLAGWLIFHILGEDQAMSRQIQAIERGAEPKRAYSEAGGFRTDPGNDALTRTLVDLYTQLMRQNRQQVLINEQLEASKTELERHRQHLEDVVQERTAQLVALAAELREARDAAEAGSRAKTRFLAAISHELRTPMHAIVGFADLLFSEGLNPDQSAMARHIVIASDQMLDLIDTIVEFAREGGEQDLLHSEPFVLATVLEDATRKAFAEAKAKGIETLLHIAPLLPTAVQGDSRRIGSILRQFASNAVKFTEKGSVRVEARLASSHAPGTIRVRITVTDTGIGISRENQDAIFGIFTQLDDGLARKFGGTGLGLALARQQARLLGGEVGVEGEPGRGSSFWLEVPLIEGDISHDAGAAASHLDARPAPVAGRALNTATELDPAKALAQFEQLLEQDDTRASGALCALMPTLRSRFGERADVLSRQVAAFEFGDALCTLRKLTGRDAKNHIA